MSSTGTRNQPLKNEKYLNYKQDKFIYNKDHFVCLKGTWGCGKSLAGLLAADKECADNPGNLYLVIRKEWVDLRDSTLHDWESNIGRPIDGNKNVVYPNKSVLMFRHGDDINALKNTNLGGCLMVQAEEQTEDDFWFINGRLRRKEGTRQLRLECNYDGHNWIYRLFNEQKVGTLLTTNTFDNIANLPPDYIPNLEKLPKRLKERHLYGSDADMEGIVWDEFSREKNVCDPFYIPNGWEKTIALDHGFTNPTAVLWAAHDWDGKTYIYDEHYEGGKPVSYHAQKINERVVDNVRRRLIDPSCSAKTQQKRYESGIVELHSIIDEYKDYGIRFEPADNSLLPGINRVNEAFKHGTLIIFKNCVNLIREVENWKWRKLRPTQEKENNQPDEPMGKDDHANDAMRYIIMSRPQASEINNQQDLSHVSPLYKMQELRRIREEARR